MCYIHQHRFLHVLHTSAQIFVCAKYMSTDFVLCATYMSTDFCMCYIHQHRFCTMCYIHEHRFCMCYIHQHRFCTMCYIHQNRFCARHVVERLPFFQKKKILRPPPLFFLPRRPWLIGQGGGAGWGGESSFQSQTPSTSSQGLSLPPPFTLVAKKWIFDALKY